IIHCNRMTISVFFFQAEDGIRDRNVTGVQTCALPISSGSEEIAAIIFEALQKLAQQSSIHLVFQCCEHLNRALVVEKETMQVYGLTEVSVIPVREAGGAMASYAFKHFKNPVVVESIQAHAGIDIGDTMIGMRLREVAVPLRFKQKTIGNARVTGARTRPRLIGGPRAQYAK